MTPIKKEYVCDIYYTATRTVKVKAKNRDEAIEKASRRAEVLGIDSISMRVPFLEGDE